jgi:hypothetical protein
VQEKGKKKNQGSRDIDFIVIAVHGLWSNHFLSYFIFIGPFNLLPGVKMQF